MRYSILDGTNTELSEPNDCDAPRRRVGIQSHVDSGAHRYAHGLPRTRNAVKWSNEMIITLLDGRQETVSVGAALAGIRLRSVTLTSADIEAVNLCEYLRECVYLRLVPESWWPKESE